MAKLNPKTLPVLSDLEGYSNWRADMEIWEMFTDLEKKKRGPVVFLSLTGQTSECVRALGAAKIDKETGVKVLLKSKTRYFLKTEIHEHILLSRSCIITDECQV